MDAIPEYPSDRLAAECICSAMLSRGIESIHDLACTGDDRDPYLVIARACFEFLVGHRGGVGILEKLIRSNSSVPLLAFDCLAFMLHDQPDRILQLNGISNRFKIDAFLRLGHLSAAQELLTSIGDDAFAWNERAVYHYLCGNFKSAIECINSAGDCADAQVRVAIAMNCGHCLRRLGQWEDAIASYSEALTWEAVQGDAYVGIAVCQVALGAFEDALLKLNDCLAVNPNHPAVPVLLGWLMANDQLTQGETRLLSASNV